MQKHGCSFSCGKSVRGSCNGLTYLNTWEKILPFLGRAGTNFFRSGPCIRDRAERFMSSAALRQAFDGLDAAPVTRETTKTVSQNIFQRNLGMLRKLLFIFLLGFVLCASQAAHLRSRPELHQPWPCRPSYRPQCRGKRKWRQTAADRQHQPQFPALHAPH